MNLTCGRPLGLVGAVIFAVAAFGSSIGKADPPESARIAQTIEALTNILDGGNENTNGFRLRDSNWPAPRKLVHVV